MKSKYLYAGLAGLALAAAAFSLSSCASIPDGATAVKPFNKDKYLGKWYEIARLDFKYEKGLSRVTADYSLTEKGNIRVLNRGFKDKSQEWKESVGKAKLVGDPQEARLKVSFFGPFYSGYNVINIDPEYRYALVAGNDLKYLWLLSREKTMPEDVKQKYLTQAKGLGYKIDDLVWTKQDQ